MERPNFKEIFGECKTLTDVHKSITAEPELFNYAQQLDQYIDYLESKLCEGKETTDELPVSNCIKPAVKGSFCDCENPKYGYTQPVCFHCRREVKVD